MRMFLTPKWLLSHAFVAVMLIVMMTAGFWQLNRLDERKASNDEIRTASEAPARPMEDLLADIDAGIDVLDHTAVSIEGRYLVGDDLLVANRTFDTQPGFWWVTPIELADGRVVAVSRGWVPRGVALGTDGRVVETPTGNVQVAGRLFDNVDDGAVGSPIEGVAQVNRMDLEAVEEALGVDVVDRWVQLENPAWSFGDVPVPVPRPTLDEGPHLSYAFQWFFFSASTVVAYALILRRRRRDALIPRDDS